MTQYYLMADEMQISCLHACAHGGCKEYKRQLAFREHYQSVSRFARGLLGKAKSLFGSASSASEEEAEEEREVEEETAEQEDAREEVSQFLRDRTPCVEAEDPEERRLLPAEHFGKGSSTCPVAYINYVLDEKIPRWYMNEYDIVGRLEIRLANDPDYTIDQAYAVLRREYDAERRREERRASVREFFGGKEEDRSAIVPMVDGRTYEQSAAELRSFRNDKKAMAQRNFDSFSDLMYYDLDGVYGSDADAAARVERYAEKKISRVY